MKLHDGHSRRFWPTPAPRHRTSSKNSGPKRLNCGRCGRSLGHVRLLTVRERRYLKGDVWKTPKPLALVGGGQAKILDWDNYPQMPRSVVECHKRCERGGRRSRYVYRYDTLAEAYLKAGPTMTTGVDL